MVNVLPAEASLSEIAATLSLIAEKLEKIEEAVDRLG